MSDDDDKLAFERAKMAADSVKHVSTLATGTIVITATFFDKLPKPLSGSGWLVAAIGGMIVCLLCSFICLWGIGIVDWWIPGGGTKQRARVFKECSQWMFMAFCIGVLCLGIFTINNILNSK